MSCVNLFGACVMWGNVMREQKRGVGEGFSWNGGDRAVFAEAGKGNGDGLQGI